MEDSEERKTPGEISLVGSPTTNSLNLEWKPPADGETVTEYRVEHRTPDKQRWTDIGVKLAAKKGTTATVSGLRPNQEYLVRVAAKSAKGWSSPTESRQPFKTASENEIPRITSKLPKKVTVKFYSKHLFATKFSTFSTPIVLASST